MLQYAFHHHQGDQCFRVALQTFGLGWPSSSSNLLLQIPRWAVEYTSVGIGRHLLIRILKSFLCPCFSTESIVIDSIANAGFFFPLQSARAWITNFHMAFGDSMDHGHSHDLWHQHMPWPSTLSPVAVQTTDINMVLCNSTDQRHHHRLQQQHRLRTPTWTLIAAQPIVLNMASGSTIDYRHLAEPR